MTAFEVFVALCDTTRVVDSVGGEIRAEPRRDGKVPGSRWAQPPPGHVHVSRAKRSNPTVMLSNAAPALIRGTAEGPVREEPRLLKLRVQVGGFSGMKNHVAKKVVATRAVSPTTTHERVVAVTVQDPIAERALSVNVTERDAKPASQHANKKGRFIVELRSLRGSGVKVQAGPFSLHKVKVGAPRPAG